MKKYLVFFIILVAMVALPAMSFAWSCPPGQEKKGWKCVPIEQPEDGGITNNVETDINNRNSNTSFNTNIIDVDSRNTNMNKNLNLNLVDVENEIDMDQKQNQNQRQNQGQIQLQGQGQGQGQDQRQTAHNEGVEQTIVINEAEPKANHVSAAGPAVPSGQVDAGATAFKAKLHGYDILQRQGTLTNDQAKMLAKGASDAEVTPGLFSKGEATSMINYGKAGEFMGYIYVTVDGPDIVATGVVGKAAVDAMANGATHMMRVYVGKDGKYLDGTAWGVGLGGQASVASSSGDSVIAPSTSLGYGKANSRNELIPEAVFECYSAAPVAKSSKGSGDDKVVTINGKRQDSFISAR